MNTSTEFLRSEKVHGYDRRQKGNSTQNIPEPVIGYQDILQQTVPRGQTVAAGRARQSQHTQSVLNLVRARNEGLAAVPQNNPPAFARSLAVNIGKDHLKSSKIHSQWQDLSTQQATQGQSAGHPATPINPTSSPSLQDSTAPTVFIPSPGSQNQNSAQPPQKPSFFNRKNIMAQQSHAMIPIPQPTYNLKGSYPATGSGGKSAQFQSNATDNQPLRDYPYNKTSSASRSYLLEDGQQDFPYRSVSERDPTKQRMPLVLLAPKTKLRPFYKPFWRYLLPKHPYPRGLKYRHRDPMGRAIYRSESDRYTRSWDGKLRNIYVQATDQVRLHATENSSTWRRTHIRRVGPLSLTIAAWATDSVNPDISKWSGPDTAKVIGKYLVASVALMVTMLWTKGIGQVRNGGQYEDLVYRYWHYMRVYKNVKENHKTVMENHWSASENQRALRPKKLCFLTERGMRGTAHIVQDTEGLPPIDYLFVAYTTSHFPGPEGQRRLLEIAEAATRNAGLSAFWIGVKCLPGLEEQGSIFNPEIHLINDIIRCCASLVIALPEPKPGVNGAATWRELLTQWGMRMWTFPEALLSPGNEIPVYVYGDDLAEPVHSIQKAQFPEYAWGDAHEARELMDHFLGNLILSRLEFAKAAIQCLLKRARMDEAKDGKDSKLLVGDMAYCYSGLLRRRPIVDGKDTEFEAFAKLDFANDSDQLFERLVCVLPKNHGHWFTNNDFWGAEPHDIQPTCQVAAVDKDSVLLDGCRGATIRWKGFKRVAHTTNFGWGKFFAVILLRINLVYFLISLAFLTFGISSGAGLLTLSLMIMLANPWLIQKLYGGKIWGTQAWFFGFEGYMDLNTIERMIYGNYQKRFQWSVAGSTLSAHKEGKHGECIGVDPTEEPEIWARVLKAAKSEVGEEKIFTLVDTYTMTVTLFSAVRPPTAVLICGVEGGMQRAVLCSYDWPSGTLCRETVLRMDTTVLNRMNRSPRLKFGFRRPDLPDVNINIDEASPPVIVKQ